MVYTTLCQRCKGWSLGSAQDQIILVGLIFSINWASNQHIIFSFTNVYSMPV